MITFSWDETSLFDVSQDKLTLLDRRESFQDLLFWGGGWGGAGSSEHEMRRNNTRIRIIPSKHLLFLFVLQKTDTTALDEVWHFSFDFHLKQAMTDKVIVLSWVRISAPRKNNHVLT